MTRRVALVTGASRGLGRTVALRLAAEGYAVLAGMRNPVPLDGVEVIRLDVTDEISVLAVADALKVRGLRLDVLVNNAGILLDGATDLLSLDPQILRRTLETNTFGPLRMAQALAPFMPKGGRIVNVSSGGGQLSVPSTWAPAYCLSKTALNALTVQLAEVLKPKGIAVNAVCPGWVRTDMGGPSAPRSLQEGADSILWLILQAPADLTGGFWRDGSRIAW